MMIMLSHPHPHPLPSEMLFPEPQPPQRNKINKMNKMLLPPKELFPSHAQFDPQPDPQFVAVKSLIISLQKNYLHFNNM